MKHVLLIGAGFSRNWGGWLAEEAFGHLIGSAEAQTDPAVRAALLRRKDNGGFEAALSDLQAAYLHRKEASEKLSLDRIQAAIESMFSDMDSGFAAQEFEFQNDMNFMVRTFLMRFDVIYSLNQDCLPELHYLNDNIQLGGRGNWNGWQLPGMRPIHDPTRQPLDKTPLQWTPEPARFVLTEEHQPFVKLHGSHNWVTNDGERLLVLGANKSVAIQGQEVLRWYFELFRQSLAEPVKLMVIGYGFRDLHVNEILLNSARAGHLKLGLIDPLGARALDQNNNTRGGAIYVRSDLDETLSPALIFTSNRALSETFGKDRVEHAKIMRLFDPSR
jgi:hypothetical protein